MTTELTSTAVLMRLPSSWTTNKSGDVLTTEAGMPMMSSTTLSLDVTVLTSRFVVYQAVGPLAQITSGLTPLGPLTTVMVIFPSEELVEMSTSDLTTKTMLLVSNTGSLSVVGIILNQLSKDLTVVMPVKSNTLYLVLLILLTIGYLSTVEATRLDYLSMVKMPGPVLIQEDGMPLLLSSTLFPDMVALASRLVASEIHNRIK